MIVNLGKVRGRGKLGVFSILVSVLVSFVACAGSKGRTPQATPLAGAAPPAISVAAAPAAPLIPSEEIATVPVSPRDPQWGAHDAPVTIVEFADFQCPFCARVQTTLKAVRDLYGPRKVRLVWKNNPLPFHRDARPAAEAAMAVFALQGNAAFWAFHDRAFGNQSALNAANFNEWAKDSGVESTALGEALASRRFSGKIEQDIALSARVGANGTPAFRINGVTVSGAQPFEKFKEVIDAQLVEATALALDGIPASEVYAALTNKHQSAEAPAARPAQETEERDTDVWKVPIAADDPVRGPADALVTIVTFSDFQCPFCKRVQDTLKQLTAAYGKDLRLVWKDNPLPFHPRARPCAYFARYAYKQKGNDAFWSVHDRLFDSQPKLEDEDLEPIARQLGLDWAAARSAIERAKFADKIDASIDLASDLQARGTPHFFINGVRLSGAQPLANFRELVDAQLAKAKALVETGVPRANVYEELMKGGKEPPPPERKEIRPPDASDPVRGDPHAKVVIHEFADFQCPFCKRVQPTLTALQKHYGSKLKLVFHHFPLPFHKNAELAAEAAQEVFAQKGSAAFWSFHDRVYGSTLGDEERTTRASLERFALAVGVDRDRFETALDSQQHKPKVDADRELASQAQINGTPAFVINGYYLSGAQPENAFRKLIERALKEAPTANLPLDSIEASHLLVSYQGAQRASPQITRTKSEAKKRAQEALDKIRRGADFAQIAKEYSDDSGSAARGGALGAFSRKVMIKEFADAAFALAPNAVSEVVETPFGYHVIRRTK
ncbi:MAG TPA: thioredoxin domain-containing protein [Polyangiaceae bacterium]|nr:thioredoxin domain-containing protein [Polyangiaceae bacterium]